MNVRNAKISDAQGIHALISSYAERDRMLFRSMADIYESLQTFTIAELDSGKDPSAQPEAPSAPGPELAEEEQQILAKRRAKPTRHPADHPKR